MLLLIVTFFSRSVLLNMQTKIFVTSAAAISHSLTLKLHVLKNLICGFGLRLHILKNSSCIYGVFSLFDSILTL